eukprot:m.27680 g.27680  ORF g.27680 m.27680 type:complete len:414 (+) comp11696_c0_seq1:78-1319(+)
MTSKRKAAPTAAVIEAPSQLPDLATLQTPTVLRGYIAHWPALRLWSPAYFAEDPLGSLQTNVAVQQRELPPDQPDWETDHYRTDISLREFSHWVQGTLPPPAQHPLSDFDVRQHWAYLSYKRVAELFPSAVETPAAGDDADAAVTPDEPPARVYRRDIDWSMFGVGQCGADSNFWFGSGGAHTQCHYDSYGTNLVAQIYGHKRWLLFPPGKESSQALRPTRLPFEESSVFSAVAVQAAAADATDSVARAQHLEALQPIQVDLQPGDVLFVPRHWWHDVTALDTAISVNLWLPHPLDRAARVHEALTRFLLSLCKAHEAEHPPGDQEEGAAAAAAEAASPVEPDSNMQDWLNPGEEAYSHAENLALLRRALSDAGGRRCQTVTTDSVLNAFCSSEVLDLVVKQLTHPHTPSALP